MKPKLFVTLLIISCLGSLALVKADSFFTTDNFSFQLNQGETFIIQNLDVGNFSIYVASGTLNATAYLSSSNIQGTLNFVPSTTGSLTVTAPSNSTVYANNVLYASSFTYEASSDNSITWIYNSEPVVTEDAAVAYAIVGAVIIGSIFISLVFVMRKRDS